MNHLETRLDWARVRALDLFAGTGSLGLECLSRGCQNLVSVDMNPEALRHLRHIRQEWRLEGWSIAGADLLSLGRPVSGHWPWKLTEPLSELPEEPALFDLVLADPPYGEPRLEGLADRLLEASLLASGGILVIEHAAAYLRIALSHSPSRILTYGQCRFSIFEKSTTAP
jgi:16S rRNA G966 N2-methylase RsmD